jgi:UDP-N-acetylmuramyl pentapeptide phosphotransferase/UDP-N-acetylglucosamine-1-phosphate transferase
LAKKYHILDIPNNRSSHAKPIIRGGGILFFLGFLIFTIFDGFDNIALFVGVTLLAVISFVDDLKELSVRQRIPIQVISIFLVIIGLNVPLHWSVITILLVTGVLVVNCYNFIDGINGMLGLYSATVFLFAGYLCYSEAVLSIDLPILLLLSILIFGYYNFRKKALFFSGDVGSMTLGILAFFLVLYLMIKLKAPVLILLLSVSLTDTLGTITKRFLAKKNILKAHREHIYEQLTDKTALSHLQISSSYAFVQIVVNLVVISSYKTSPEIQLGIVGSIGLFFSLTYWTINTKLKSRST